ncbi:MAG: choice-of-anchor D domain-containing protein [Candidatus Marithrix sp.]
MKNLQPNEAIKYPVKKARSVLAGSIKNILYASALAASLSSGVQAAVNIYSDPLLCPTSLVCGTALEAGPTAGDLEIVLDVASAAGTEITYEVTGNATLTTDYTITGAAPCVVNLATNCFLVAATTTSTLLTVTPVDDVALEGNETVTVTLLGALDGVTNIPISTTNDSATLNIVDNDIASATQPLVGITATITPAAEPGTAGQFTITASPAPIADITVNYTVSIASTAEAGADYVALAGSVTLTNAVSMKTIDIQVIDDILVEPTETIIVELDSNAAYRLGSSISATVEITNDDIPVGQQTHLFTIDDDGEMVQINADNQISPPNPATQCVSFGITTGGTEIIQSFKVGSTTDATSPDSISSIFFQPNPDNVFRRTRSLDLDNLWGLGYEQDPDIGIFDATFSPPVSSVDKVTTYNRTLEVWAANDTYAKPIEIPINAFLVPNNLPAIQAFNGSTSNAAMITNGTSMAIDMGTTVVGSTLTKTFTVKNSGYAELRLQPTTVAFLTGTGNGFSAGPYVTPNIGAPFPTPTTSGCPSTLTHEETTFTVTLSASEAGEYQGTLSIVGTSPTGVQLSPYTFPVKGIVEPPPPVLPEIDVWDGDTEIKHEALEPIDFGNTTIGSPISRTLTFKNPSSATLSIYDINTPEGLKVTSTALNFTVNPKSELSVTIDLEATVAGTYEGPLTIASNDADNNDGDGVENPYTIFVRGVVSADAASIATLALTAPTNGNITSNIGGINCGSAGTNCEAGYNKGDSVTLFAVSDSTATFTSWGGDCTGSNNPLLINLDADKNCTATFSGGTVTDPITDPVIDPITDPVTGNVDLIITSPIDGKITSQPEGIDCGIGATTCQNSYAPNSAILLTATADSNANFISWGGDCSGNTSPLPITIDVAKNCTAIFEKVIDSPEIQVFDGATEITDGATTAIDIGTTNIGQPITKTFTIKNSGKATLDLYGYRLPNGFYVSSIYPRDLAVDGQFTFDVQLNTFAAGNFNGPIELYSTDSDENPFDFTITGTVNSIAGTVTDPVTGTVTVTDPVTGIVTKTVTDPVTGTVTITVTDPVTIPGTGTVVGAEIQVLDGQLDIISGTNVSTDFGTTALGSHMTKTFTVKNVGTANLTLNSPVTLTGNGFNITSFVTPTELVSGTSTNFDVTLDATNAGNFIGTLSFGNTDADESAFNFPISGIVSEELKEEINCFGTGLLSGGVCTVSQPFSTVSATGGTTDSVMKGGLSLYQNGKFGAFTQTVTINRFDSVLTSGVIKTDTNHVGKKADIMVIGYHVDSNYPRGYQWYQLASCTTCPLGWKVGNVESDETTAIPLLTKVNLSPLKTIDKMPEYLTVDMFSGVFGILGQLDMYLAYRVEEGTEKGKVIVTSPGISIMLTE